MTTALKTELILEGLDCAHCSANIENELNKIEGIDASINFMMKTLILETSSDYDHKKLIDHVKSIIDKHEPGVKIKEKLGASSNIQGKNGIQYIERSFILEGLG